MRKMRDYVVSGKRIFVGLEDSKRTWKLCVRSGGMIVAETTMPAEYENLRRYFGERYPRCEIRVMYEAGFSGFWLHDLLTEDGIACIVTPAHTVTQEKVQKVKTDKVDARRLAKNLEAEDYRCCAVPDQERREDRQISRTLTHIQRQIVATKNRIRKFLDFHGLNAGYPLGAWKAGEYRRVRELVLRPSLQTSLTAYLQILDSLEQEQRRLLAELKGLCQKERYGTAVRLKRSLPGVGWLSAIRFTLEWGDLSRFENGKRMASFTGLTSSEYSSGESTHRGRITGQGSRQVRAWLIECAWRAVQLDPVLMAKFRAVAAHSGSKKKAIVAVARKLAVRMRAVELTGCPYSCGVIE